MKVAIIGGGITGLTAAYDLSGQGAEVTVFEKEKELGGLAVGLKQPHWEWSLEKGYHHLFTNDASILGLLSELGLGDKIIIKRPVTANFTTSGQTVQFDRPGDLLSYPDFSIFDKVRTGMLLAFLKLNPVWKPLENLTARQLFISVGGRNAWKHLWEPLMVGKFGDLADSVAASWMWARITKRTPSLAYIAGGFRTLVETIQKEILANGGTLATGTSVNRIESSGAGFRVYSSSGLLQKVLPKSELFDKILLTIPTPLIIKLLPGLTDSLGAASTVPHLHAQILILETKEPILENTYWLSILDRTFPFLAVVAHTNFMDPEHFGGHHLTYFGNYLPTGHRYLSMPKERLLKEFMPFIKRLNPNLNSKFLILNSFSFIGPFAQPVHQLHYSTLAPPLITSIPGLFIANLDSVYPWDRGTNYAVELGQKAARRIINNV